jgi:ubiquinone/menaquinone biosynthesis C-methylase UbiE
MSRPKSHFDFRLMAFTYKLRDLFSPPMNVLKEVGIRQGFSVLDYGCGAGSYVVPLTDLVGSSGRIYAVDIHPIAIRTVQSKTAKRRLANVKAVQSDCNTGLSDASIDAALLYDILHELDKPNDVLRELHRVLKPSGILSVSDHHMKEADVLSNVTSGGLFKLSARGKRTYSFEKQG